MRNNPYHKNLKDQMPLFMQGPSSVSALISNEEQKNIVGKAKQIPDPKEYSVRNVSFNMVSPPVLNKNFTFNPSDLLKIEMGQTEITRELFQVVMGWDDSANKTSPQNPVEDVNWYDCVSFCNKLSNLLGFEECYEISGIGISRAFGHIVADRVTWDASKSGFRLPTENEWEIFAKAGTNNIWSGTNNENELDQYAWYSKNSESRTHPVGEKLPNEWGLYDMTGNVWEWCWDSDDLDDTEKRVVRGGCYGNSTDYCRVAYRSRFDGRSSFRGFRLLRSFN